MLVSKSNFRRCVYKGNSCSGKTLPHPSQNRYTPIAKKEIRAERNPVKNGCTPLCEDSCSDPSRDSPRPSQENPTASPPPPTNGASHRARTYPLLNAERQTPIEIFQTPGKWEFSCPQGRERPTGPLRGTTARGPPPPAPIAPEATGRGSLRSPRASPRVTGRRQEPLSPRPHLPARRTQAGARPCGEHSSSGERGAAAPRGRRPGAMPARTGRGVRAGTPRRTGESHGPRGAWQSSRNPAALQPPAGKQTKGREASGEEDGPPSPGKVTLQLPSLALRVPAPRAGRPGAAPVPARGPTRSPGLPAAR